MAEPHKWGEWMRDDRANVALLLITLGLTVLTDLTIAIGTGVTLGLALRLRRNANPPDWTPRDK